MYVIGNSGDDVNEYTLSTAFDVSTASFVDSFDVMHQEVILDKHTKCTLRKDKNFDAIFFNNNQTLPDKIRVVYTIDANEFNGKTNIQIIIKNIVE